jgi:type IV fimbrial biogenesis protein FimT
VLVRPNIARGFNLVEVMVALAIVAMLIAFVAPSSATWIQNTRLRSTAESVARGLQMARLEAMKRNTTVAFNLTDANSSAWTVCLYDVVNDVCQAAQPLLAQRDASEDNSTTKLGADTALSNPATALAPGNNVPSRSGFDPYGRLSTTVLNPLMRIDVRNPTLAAADERRLVIFINLGGQIRVCDPKLSIAVNPQGCQ